MTQGRELTLAKISRPVLSGIYPRRKLFRLIGSPGSAPIIWIAGPPGSGKTSLVSSYLDVRKLPCLWYQVDEGDADVASFFHYMGLGALKAAPRCKRDPLPHLTPEYTLGISTFTVRFFEKLYHRVKTPSVLVFDNYHEVAESSLFHAVIRDGLSALPEGGRVILISRSLPPPALMRLRVHNQMNVLCWNDLRINAEELRGIMRLRGAGNPGGDAVDCLLRRTDGWAAGIVLLLERSKVEGNVHPTGSRAPQEVFDYFAGEILAKTEPETTDFLLKTAVFPEMTASMAESLTGKSQAGAILADLSRNSYFTLKRTHQEETYQYHPMFREFLMSRARDTLSSQELAEIQRKTASILESNGRVEDAVELFLKSREWGEAARLILTHAQSMTAQGRGQALEGWIRGLPETSLETNPWMVYWFGVCKLPAAPSEASGYFERAFGLFREQNDGVGILLSLTGMVEAVFFGHTTFKEFDRLIPVLQEILAGFKEFPSSEIEARFISSYVSAHILRKTSIPDIEHWEKRSLSLAESVSDGNVSMQIILLFGFLYAFYGNLGKAAHYVDICRRMTRTRTITPFQMITFRDFESFYCFLAADFENNRKASDEGRALAAASGVHTHDIGLFGHSAAGALSVGDHLRAKELLSEMASALERIPAVHVKALYHLLDAWRGLLAHELHSARMQADLAVKFGDESGTLLTEAWPHIIRALVLHELRNDAEALEAIAHSRRICLRAGTRQAEFRCLLAEAQFALDRKDDAAGIDLLREAMAIGREHGYANAFFWISSVMTKLCIRALDAGIEVEYVRDLIRKRGLVPENPPLECENWPWPVRIYTLGRFGLVKEEKQVPSSGKVQHRPLALLKALIALGGREVSEERLADLLWPEADGDAAHNALSITLHRLRQLLGLDKAVRFQDGKASLDQRYCWVDVWAFERIAGQASCLHTKGGDTEQFMRLASRAIDLYKGHFLPADAQQIWTVSYRERVRDKYLNFITAAGDCMEKAGRWLEAAAYYRRALGVDELSEQCHQRLMICYGRMGLKAEAMRAYNRCRAALSTSFGLDPSPETERLREEIVKGGQRIIE